MEPKDLVLYVEKQKEKHPHTYQILMIIFLLIFHLSTYAFLVYPSMMIPIFIFFILAQSRVKYMFLLPVKHQSTVSSIKKSKP